MPTVVEKRAPRYRRKSRCAKAARGFTGGGGSSATFEKLTRLVRYHERMAFGAVSEQRACSTDDPRDRFRARRPCVRRELWIARAQDDDSARGAKRQRAARARRLDGEARAQARCRDRGAPVFR